MLRSLSLAGVLVGVLAFAGPAHAATQVTQPDPTGDASLTSAGVQRIDVTSLTVGHDAAAGTISLFFAGSFVHENHSANRFTVALGRTTGAGGACSADLIVHGQSYGDAYGQAGTYVELDDADGFIASGTGTAAAGAVTFTVTSPRLTGALACATDVSAVYADHDYESTDTVAAFGLTAPADPAPAPAPVVTPDPPVADQPGTPADPVVTGQGAAAVPALVRFDAPRTLADLRKAGAGVSAACQTACTVQVRLTLGAKVVGTGTATATAAGRAALRVRLSADGRKALESRTKAQLVLRVIVREAGRAPQVTTRTLNLT